MLPVRVCDTTPALPWRAWPPSLRRPCLQHQESGPPGACHPPHELHPGKGRLGCAERACAAAAVCALQRRPSAPAHPAATPTRLTLLLGLRCLLPSWAPQEDWDALDQADRDLAASLPLETHWAPSYTVHPRTGDCACLCACVAGAALQLCSCAGATEERRRLLEQGLPSPVPIRSPADYPGINKPVAVADWLASKQVRRSRRVPTYLEPAAAPCAQLHLILQEHPSWAAHSICPHPAALLLPLHVPRDRLVRTLSS